MATTEKSDLEHAAEPKWERTPIANDRKRRSLMNLFQCAAQVVDSILRMARVDDFENHVIACLELADYGVELLFGSGGLFVDAGDDQAGLESLQIAERTGTHGLDDHTGGVDFGQGRVGLLADHEAELGFAGIALIVGALVGLLILCLGEDLIQVADGDGCVHRLAIAHITEPDGGARPAAGDLVDQVVAVLHGAAIDGGDDVAGLESGLVGRAAMHNLLDQHACLEAVNAIDGPGEPLVEANADGSAGDLVAGADEVVVDLDDGVGRHGEADALVAVGLRVDGGVDAYDFAVHVQERSAGVAGIDGGIGLDEVLKLALRAGLDGAVLGGDYASSDGLRQGEGAADGFDPVADFGGVGVAELNGRQGCAGVDFDDREVGGLVDADDMRGTAFVTVVWVGGELDEYLVGLLDDVVVGDDVALGIDDEAGAERLAHLIVVSAVLVGSLAAEEAVEEVLEVALALALALLLVVVAVAVAGVLRMRVGNGAIAGPLAAFVHGLLGKRLGVDVDHSRADFLGDAHKVVRGHGVVDDLQRSGIGACVLLLLPANTMSSEGDGHDCDGKRAK